MSEELANLVADVQTAYTFRRHMTQPKWDGSAQRWRVCWHKTARMLMERSIDLDEFMDAQFALKVPFPTPIQLYTPDALRRYETYVKHRPDPCDDPSKRLMVEMRFLETRTEIGYTFREIVELPASPLSPAFCYVVARIFGDEAVAARFKESAHQQLVRTPSAAVVYSGLLPGVFDGGK